MFSVFKMFCKSQDLNLAEMSTVGTEQGEKEYGFSDDMVELLLFALEDLKRSLKERGFNLMIRFGIAENVIEGIVKEVFTYYICLFWYLSTSDTSHLYSYCVFSGLRTYQAYSTRATSLYQYLCVLTTL
ncbi:uncharacterized protein LOC124896749 [Capsicum annuum]|uniref:uncharacterized protein LOC124896749 n=1 Tax=Capsicum annuum TaxID=4072 RepID=UPI001FB193BD|nr:uncharacterized protein LOC124896749 [Capsicum annuum]